MKHDVTVSVSSNEKPTKVLNAREVTFREKLLTALFGKKAKVIVLTPYNSVNEITIEERMQNYDNKRNIAVASN
jgi:hypothetical protein